ncbi:MAG: MoaD/ThiS family protein [Dehalococcoidia bacterium]
MSEVTVDVMPMLAPYFSAAGGEHLRFTAPIENGDTILDLLGHLADEHAALDGVLIDRSSRELTEAVRVVLNDRVVELAGGLDTVLVDGDTILILPAFAGGACEEIARRMPCP